MFVVNANKAWRGRRFERVPAHFNMQIEKRGRGEHVTLSRPQPSTENSYYTQKVYASNYF